MTIKVTNVYDLNMEYKFTKIINEIYKYGHCDFFLYKIFTVSQINPYTKLNGCKYLTI